MMILYYAPPLIYLAIQNSAEVAALYKWKREG
jgi:hypothetical protein